MKIRRSSANVSALTGLERCTMIAIASAGAGCAAAWPGAVPTAAPARRAGTTTSGSLAITSEHEHQLRAHGVDAALLRLVGVLVLPLDADPLHGVDPQPEDVGAIRSRESDEGRRRIDRQAIVAI